MQLLCELYTQHVSHKVLTNVACTLKFLLCDHGLQREADVAFKQLTDDIYKKFGLYYNKLLKDARRTKDSNDDEESCNVDDQYPLAMCVARLVELHKRMELSNVARLYKDINTILKFKVRGVDISAEVRCFGSSTKNKA